MALASPFRDEANEGEFALARFAKVELEQAGVAGRFVDHRVKLDSGIVENGRKPGVVEDQPREPQPSRPDQPEQAAVSVGIPRAEKRAAPSGSCSRASRRCSEPIAPLPRRRASPAAAARIRAASGPIAGAVTVPAYASGVASSMSMMGMSSSTR